MQQSDSCAPPYMLQPPTCITAKWEGWVTYNWVGSLLSVSVNISSCLASSLFCANSASCKESSSRLFFVGTWDRSCKIAWSLAAIFSISSNAYSGVFNLIFPLAEVSNNYLDCGLKPSMKSFKCFTQGFIWKLMEWGDNCLAFSCLGLREVLFQKLFHNLFPSLQIVSLERMQQPLGFSSQGKWKQAKLYCILQHTCNFHSIANFYISSKACVRVFIWQTMK